MKPEMNDPVALLNRGNALLEEGRLAEAEGCYRRVLAIQPNHAAAHGNLGIVLHRLGRPAEAEACYRRVLAIWPEHAGTHNNLGNVLKDLGRTAEAEASYRRALAIRPGYANACCNLGSLLRNHGRLDEAAACLHEAIRIQPDHLDAHSGLGNVYLDLGRLEEAVGCYRRALAVAPDHAGVQNNLGYALKTLGRLAEAEDRYRRALALDPDFAEAHDNLGSLLQDLGRLVEAEACYRRAIEIRPDHPGLRSSLLFCLGYQGCPPEAHRDEAREYGRVVAAKVKERYSAWSCPVQPERLRVGFVSGDLWNHPVGHFLEGVLAHIDPTRIELFAYPSASKSDGLTRRLRPRFAAWKSLFGLDDEAAARLIHADGVHVLVDLSGHTTHNRLPVFGWRPAPVQASWLGYFATTGVAEMDWFLADEVGVPPAQREHFLEKVWYLPDTRLCFTPPDMDLPPSPLPALRRGFVCFGSFQQLPKINDETLRAWGRVLAACPSSRLRLQNDRLSDPSTLAALRERLKAHAVDPRRVDLHGPMPRGEYLAAHAEVDVLLDTSPFPGGTTTCEALWMGVPTLTLAGETLIARQGASLLSAAGLPDWIAHTEGDYVAKAVAHASDLESLARLRAGLRAQVLASPLFDAPRFARHLEDALWGMWRQSLVNR